MEPEEFPFLTTACLTFRENDGRFSCKEAENTETKIPDSCEAAINAAGRMEIPLAAGAEKIPEQSIACMLLG